MTTVRRTPHFSIWVPGKPKSHQGKGHQAYLQRVQTEARKSIAEPLTSYRIDVDIIFGAKNRNLRADVDNVAKLILDGLKGILYQDDRQVRSVRAVALPGDDTVRVRGSYATHLRLKDGDEFLINVYVGNTLTL